MPVIGFKKGIATVVNVWAVPGTVKGGTDGDDIEEDGGNCGDWSPVLRNGIDKSGECVVIPNDETDHAKTLAQLLALESPLGLGDYTISVDGVAKSWHALVSVDLFGKFCQRVRFKWEGTVES